MMHSKICLSDETLEQLSTGELSPTAVREIEIHVDNCNCCRELLASEFDSRWHDEICPVLRTCEYEAYTPTDGEDEEHEAQSLETALRLLGPTDDPHMLGRIGTYEIVSVIGRGGMGIVFKAFDATLNRFVAIKMLLPHLATSGAAKKRFAREGRAAAAVIDDHVMPIYNVDQWRATPYLVTQYSGGPTLQQRIKRQGPLDVKEILRIAMQTARGLEAAHAQGLVHRDVKPSNILLDGTVERAMLTDFGLARAVDDASITRTGTISGTPQYMSPEQARGGNVDARSDLFGLGCVMYAMCTGRPPFRADNSYAVLRLIADEDPRPIQEVNPDIPAWLCSIISKLMSKQTEDRYADAAEVAELFEACLAHVQQPAKFDLPVTCNAAESDTGSSLFGNRWKMAGLAFLFLAAGGLWLNELNHGKLIIECSSDDVPIRITQGDTVVESMTVTKKGATVKVAAGKYRVEVDGDHREFSVENNSVVLRRGGTESVKITLREQPSATPLRVDQASNESGMVRSEPTNSLAPDSPLLDPRVTVMGNGLTSQLAIKRIQITDKLRNSVTIARSGYDGLELGSKINLGRANQSGIEEVLGEAKIIQLSEKEAVGEITDYRDGILKQATSLVACDPEVTPFNEPVGNGTVLVDLRLNKSNGETISKSTEVVKRLLEIGGENIRIALWPQAIRTAFAVVDNNSSTGVTPARLAVIKYLQEQGFIENDIRVLHDKTGNQILELDSTNEIEIHPAYLSNDSSVDRIGWNACCWTDSEGKQVLLNVDLRKRPLLGMLDIVSAELVPTDGSLNGNYSVTIKLKPDAEKRFAEQTKSLIAENPNVHLAVFANESFTFAARLVSPIPNGKMVISGRFSKQEAQNLISEFDDVEYSRKRFQRLDVDQNRDQAGVKFDTPEQLMEHFADCQFRQDFAGLVSCLDDEWVRMTAYSWLSSVVHWEQLLVDKCDFSKNREVVSENVRQLEKLQTFLDDAGINQSERQAFAALIAGAEASDGPELSTEQTTASHLKIVKRPRAFVTAFAKFANVDADFAESAPLVRPLYRISHDRERTIATEEASGKQSDLIFQNGSWRITSDSIEMPAIDTGTPATTPKTKTSTKPEEQGTAAVRSESPDVEQLMGTWTLIEQRLNGRVNPKFERYELILSQNKHNSDLSVQVDYEIDSLTSPSSPNKYRMTIAPDGFPKQMNWFGKGVLIQSIYEINQDTLRIAYFGKPEHARPKNFIFDPAVGQGLSTWRFKRKRTKGAQDDCRSHAKLDASAAGKKSWH